MKLFRVAHLLDFKRFFENMNCPYKGEFLYNDKYVQEHFFSQKRTQLPHVFISLLNSA